MKNKKYLMAAIAAIVIIAAVVVIIFAAKNASDTPAKTNVTPTATATTDSEENIANEETTISEETPEGNLESDTEVSTNTSTDTSKTENEVSSEAQKVTPTFMYFISESDTGYEQTNTMLKELQEQYGDRVRFDIVNVDENPDAKKNFPVDGQTPALIMLNTSNDISALEFQCSDKDTLIKDIENALK
jgi:thioredoxin-like negative regulator of GroEL